MNELANFALSQLRAHHISRRVGKGNIPTSRATMGIFAGVLKDPVIGSCCQSILGCRDCVLRSMQASGDKCPMCRGDHPQITVVKGLGEMYQALGRMFPPDESWLMTSKQKCFLTCYKYHIICNIQKNTMRTSFSCVSIQWWDYAICRHNNTCSTRQSALIEYLQCSLCGALIDCHDLYYYVCL